MTTEDHSKPSEENRELARYAAGVIGGTWKVHKYHHDHIALSIPLLSCLDRPNDGATTYATVGLSDLPMLQEGKEFPARLELVGACDSDEPVFANILVAAAFYIIRNGWFCFPGAVLQHAVDEYYASRTMQHLYFAVPYLWSGLLEPKQFGQKTVAWLMAIPISHAEYEYRVEHGDRALEELLERNDVNILDLNRPSSV